MSTLTSKDMHLERSSTRLHAPPGGKSTFSIGGNYGSDENTKVSRPNSANTQSNIFGSGSNDDDRFSGRKPSTQNHGRDNMSDIMSGSSNASTQQVSSRGSSQQQGGSMASLLSGGNDGADNQPTSHRGRRQAPGGTSSIVIG